jgi:hypothetical protein
MGRMRRSSAIVLLVAYLAITVAIFASARSAVARTTELDAATAALDLVLVWFVWRGSRAAWTIAISLWFIVLALLVTGSPAWRTALMIVFTALQLTLLVGPALRVRWRTRSRRSRQSY